VSSNQNILLRLRNACSDDLYSVIIAFEQWLSYEKMYSKHTIASYLYDLTDFVTYLHGLDNILIDNAVLSEQANLFHIRNFLQQRCATHVVRSNKRFISSFKTFAKFTNNKYQLDLSSANKLRQPRMPSTLPRPIDQNEIVTLIDNIPHIESKKATWIISMHQAIFTLLYATGMRISELVALNLTDFFDSILTDKYVKVYGKGKKERVIPVVNIAIDILKLYLLQLFKIDEETQELFENRIAIKCQIIEKIDNSLHEDNLSFCNKNNTYNYNQMPLFLSAKGNRISARALQLLMQELRIKCGLYSSATPHSFRHSFASHLINSGVGIRSVQELLGHQSPTTTQIYTQISSAQILSEYKKHHPRDKE
jgi:site-specific recombinase XerD